MMTFGQLINALYDKYPGTDKQNDTLRGKEFEKLMKRFFEVDPLYRQRFKNVWLWMEYPNRNRKIDTGVDLVARDIDGDDVGIQCKFYGKNTAIDHSDVSKFFITCEKYKIKKYIIVHTADHITKEAQNTIDNKQCQVLDRPVLENCTIDWNTNPVKIHAKPSKNLHEWQEQALVKTIKGFENNSRGKLIMACGTGKTLTALRIAEHFENNQNAKFMLYLVPSISLIQQTMREWSENTKHKHRYIAVCSDPTVGEHDLDDEGGTITELEMKPSTSIVSLKKQISGVSNTTIVIFSTYQSINVVSECIQSLDKKFDIVFCDEAHRTAGLRKTKKSLRQGKSKDNYWTAIHEDEKIPSTRRLYMTATQKVFDENTRDGDNVPYNMNDEKIYGKLFYELTFYDAVHKYHALSDFQVKIAILPEDRLADYIGMLKIINDPDSSFKNKLAAEVLWHKTKYAAVWHAILHPDDMKTKNPLQKIIVFTNEIESSKIFAGNIEKKKHASFEAVAESYNTYNKDTSPQSVEVRHVDGKSNAAERKTNLDWLKRSHDDEATTRIISNAKCLSEGVDVPSLDAVVFMEPKKSIIDIVQSVGRVMRKKTRRTATGSEVSEDRYGYVILPVVVPSVQDPKQVLDNNEPFRTVWQVLNALRSHDRLLVPEISTLNLSTPGSGERGKKARVKFYFLGVDPEKEAKLHSELVADMRSRLVKKVGDKNYVTNYGKRLKQKTKIVEERLDVILENENKKGTSPKPVTKIVDDFTKRMQDLVSPSITEKDSKKMISQHVVLQHVFKLLFAGDFATNSPIVKKLDSVIRSIGLGHLTVGLESFYEEVEREMEVINSSPNDELREKRQEFIKLIYQSYFESVDKEESERAGVVYTPIEIIDFINNSVQHILNTEFNKSYSDKSVKVLDPFTGTGTFISRLIDSGFIDNVLESKYAAGLFANEFILLAYYIATVNIETTFAARMSRLGRKVKYAAFSNINYVDTLFQTPGKHHETDEDYSTSERLDEDVKELKRRIILQNKENICVIETNPPYSRNQKNADNQNQNIFYDQLNKRIKNTYRKQSTHGNQNSLHDLYIYSLRWMTDRIGDAGVVGIVVPTSFVMLPTLNGVRSCLEDEFTSLWCFDLRGDGRSGKGGRNVFEYVGQEGGTRTPVAIIILVKNPAKTKCRIKYYEIEDKYRSGKEKRARIKELSSIANIRNWKNIDPDKYHDWLNQRDESLMIHTQIGNTSVKKGRQENAIFKTYSGGIQTKKDLWVYNYSKSTLEKNMKSYIEYLEECGWKKPTKVDPKRGKWTTGLDQVLKKYKPIFSKKHIRLCLYRPFFSQYLYFDQRLMPGCGNAVEFFPEGKENLVISVADKPQHGDFSVFISNTIQDGEVVYHNQCFPLYIYPKTKRADSENKTCNITDFALKEYRSFYQDQKITKKDIFYYVYGLLHHPDYIKLFTNNLSKELPRVPMARGVFWEIKIAGEKLADIHLNWNGGGGGRLYDLGKPKITLKRFGKSLKFGTKNGEDDETKIFVDGFEMFDNIPKIKYRIKNRTPLKWAIENYRLREHNRSKIINNSTLDIDPVDLIRRMVYVGVKSDEVIDTLSRLPLIISSKNKHTEKSLREWVNPD